MPPSPAPRPRAQRLQFVDWLRGVAVLCMILWHSMDAWTLPADRTPPIWPVIIVLGGWAAPLFLFLAGVSVALAGHSRLQHADLSRREIAWRLQKRGWQVFGLAHLFRLQSFLLTPTASWSSLLKPDILNILGLGLVVTAFCWGRAATRARQVLWLIGPAAVIVMMTPYSRLWTWPALLRPYLPRLEAYIRPVPGLGVFSVFPWVAVVFVGAFIGSVIVAWSQRGEAQLQKRLSVISVAITLAGIGGAFLPSPLPTQFWTTSVSYFLIRIGFMTLGMPIGWWWLRLRGPARSGPMLTFGRASLFVYWVHVEVAYGVLSYPWHQRLPIGQAFAAFVGLTAVMVMAARLWSSRAGPIVPDYLRVGPETHFPPRTNQAFV